MGAIGVVDFLDDFLNRVLFVGPGFFVSGFGAKMLLTEIYSKI